MGIFFQNFTLLPIANTSSKMNNSSDNKITTKWKTAKESQHCPQAILPSIQSRKRSLEMQDLPALAPNPEKSGITEKNSE